jgi:serine-type D-Ala-D-Ala carboxypeptidase/endopeptidase
MKLEFKHRFVLAALVTAMVFAGGTGYLNALPGAGKTENSTEKEMVLDILKKRVDHYEKAVGIVAGIIDNTGTRIYSYGKMGKNRPPVDGNTLFEIGSITKVFTCIILADMVEKGELTLTDPVSKFLPKTVNVPSRGGKEITLMDLATHTSGLPRLPNNLKPADPTNPYADYTVQQMYDFLSNYTLTRDIGEKYEYSNIGMGLLGHALGLKAGKDFETLVKERVLLPLDMKDTMITIPEPLKNRFSLGHLFGLGPATYWDLPSLAGAGALRSTAEDLLKFLAVNLGFKKTKISAAVEAVQKERTKTDGDEMTVGLGWHILKVHGTQYYFHGGGTGGFRTFIGIDKKNGRGAVVLANSENDCADIARHLINPKFKLAQLEEPRKVVPVSTEVLKQYEGKYTLMPTMVCTITLKGDQLHVQLTGQPEFPIYPESETKFFYKVVDAQLTFVKDASGKVTHLVLHQNGMNQNAKKTE